MSHPSLSLPTPLTLTHTLSLWLSPNSFMCVFDMCAFCSQRVQNRTVCAWLRRATIFVSPQSLSQVKQAAERPFTLLYIQRTGGGGGEGKTIKYYIKKNIMEVLQIKECSRGCWRREHVLCDTRRKAGGGVPSSKRWTAPLPRLSPLQHRHKGNDYALHGLDRRVVQSYLCQINHTSQYQNKRGPCNFSMSFFSYKWNKNVTCWNYFLADTVTSSSLTWSVWKPHLGTEGPESHWPGQEKVPSHNLRVKKPKCRTTA